MTYEEVMNILDMKKRNVEPTAQDLLDSIIAREVNK